MKALVSAKLVLPLLLTVLLLVSFPLTFPVLGSSPKVIKPVHAPPSLSLAAQQEYVGTTSVLTLPTPYEYTSFFGDVLMLYPYTGTHVALLVNEEHYEPAVLSQIVQAVDDAYEYYAEATGREPAPLSQYQGLTTIAAVPRSCGAGCGYLGATGIELAGEGFDILFRGVADDNQFDQVVFYELGRNFWFYGDQIAYPTEDPVATGFAVFMRFMSMEAAGVEGTPYEGKDFATFRAEVEGLLDLYLADPALNWSNTLPLRRSSHPDYGGTDMFASFLFELHARFGDAFVMNIWQEVGQMPTRTTTQDAIDNFVMAASNAAGQDLGTLFAYTWRWPVSFQQPIVIPALREWTAVEGVYTFTDTARIIIDDPALNGTATVFANDLRELTYVTLPIVQGATPVAGDIVLALGATDSDIGDEGYLMEVGGTEGTFTIRAKTDAGVFYGTRTILQLLKQGHTVIGGVIRDWPSYPERSMMVDNGRKYFTPDWLKNHIRELAYLKYNYFHLHLSDDQGFHLESDTVTPTTPIISKAELAEIIALATEHHITIVPEIDMPGHMTAILPPELRLAYDDGEIPNAGYLNIASDEGYAFAQQLIEEYSPLFPGPYWHIGGDEFHVEWERLNHLRDYARSKLNDPNATAEDGFIYFINQTNQFIKAQGKHSRMWGNPLDHGEVLQFDQDIVLELWDLSVNPNDAISRGYEIMNSTFYPTYYVQGWGVQQPPRPQFPPAALYDQWTPQGFFAEQFPPYSLTATPHWTVPSPPSPKLLGGKFQIWSDNPDAQTEEQVTEGIYKKLRAMAQNNWGSPKQAADYATFEPMIETIGRASGYTEPIYDPYDFAGEIPNPNLTIPNGHYGNMTDDGGFGWQTGNCSINVSTNGFVFTLDNGQGNFINYSGVIEGSGNVVLLATSAALPQASEPIILSGNQPNRYSGLTTLKRGVVQLSKPTGVSAIPGDLVMENQGDNDELRWGAAEQIADSANLTILSTAGKLTLNGFQETINGLQLAEGARIDTGEGNDGLLTVNQFRHGEIEYAAGTYTADDAPFLIGGGRLVVLHAPYDFAGEITNPNATIGSGYYGNLTDDGAFGSETGYCSINVSTNGFLFTLDNGHGNALNYSGVIDGSGDVALLAASADDPDASEALILSGDQPNRYSGLTTLKRGVVQLDKPAGVSAIPGDLVMENQGDNDELRWAAAEQIADSANLTILSTAGKLTLNSFQEKFNSLNMADGAGIDTGPNEDGVLTVNQFWYNDIGYKAGTYTADHASFLTGGGRLVVLQSVDQPYDFAGEITNPNSTIPSGYYGNLTNDGAFGWQTRNCAINVATNSFVFTLDSGNGNPLNYSGVINGSGSVVLRAAPASSNAASEPIILSGDQPNLYSGVTILKQGVVQLGKPAGVNAIAGNLVMENQGDNDELRWAAAEQIADSANLTILSTAGKLTLEGFQETINHLQLVAGARIDTGPDNDGVLTVNQFWYNNIGYEAGTYTADNAAFLIGGGRLVVLSTPTVNPSTISSVSPPMARNQLPNEINIYGENFQNGATVSIDPTTLQHGASTSLTTTFISVYHLRAVVPSGQTPGSYNLTVTNPDSYQVTLPNAYRVLESHDDDLFGDQNGFLTTPPSLQVSDEAQLSLLVKRQGGNGPLNNVTVDFYQGDPDSGGTLIGSGTVTKIAPNSSAITTQVAWTAPAAGEHTIYALIDPAGNVTEINENNNKVQRDITILPAALDGMAPTVDSFMIDGGALNTTDQEVTLSISASDPSAPSPSTGVQSVYLIEYEFNQSTGFWLPAQQSDWLNYTTTPSTYSWTLLPSAGIKYLQVWAADGAGNISSPQIALINHLTNDSIPTVGSRFYLYPLSNGQNIHAIVTPSNGDPDLYIWRPDDEVWYSFNLALTVDEVNQSTTADGIHIVQVYGWEAAEYNLSLTMSDIPSNHSIQPQALTANDKTALSESGLGDVPEEQIQAIPAPEVSEPAAVQLANFTASDEDDHILVSWQTVSEFDNLGFNIYRSTTNVVPETALNEELLPSQVPGSGQGFVYSHSDNHVEVGITYHYWLEDVDIHGTTTLHGPVSATINEPTAVTVSTIDAYHPWKEQPTSPLLHLIQALVLLILATITLKREGGHSRPLCVRTLIYYVKKDFHIINKNI